jgi:hypothetical protein
VVLKTKIMEESDKELLDWYMKGFHDELCGTSTIESDDNLKNIAYKLGSQHAIIGDDISSIDLLSNKEILNIIKIG